MLKNACSRSSGYAFNVVEKSIALPKIGNKKSSLPKPRELRIGIKKCFKNPRLRSTKEAQDRLQNYLKMHYRGLGRL